MFLADITSQRKSQFSHFGKKALEFITSYPWPDNIRELKNAIERIVLLYDEKEIHLKPLDFLSGEKSEVKSKNDINILSYQLPTQPKALKIIEEEIITHALEHFEKNITDTAKFLKISRNKIYRRVKS